MILYFTTIHFRTVVKSDSLAQSVERQTVNLLVVGSSPTGVVAFVMIINVRNLTYVR